MSLLYKSYPSPKAPKDQEAKSKAPYHGFKVTQGFNCSLLTLKTYCIKHFDAFKGLIHWYGAILYKHSGIILMKRKSHPPSYTHTHTHTHTHPSHHFRFYSRLGISVTFISVLLLIPSPSQSLIPFSSSWGIIPCFKHFWWCSAFIWLQKLCRLTDFVCT